MPARIDQTPTMPPVSEECRARADSACDAARRLRTASDRCAEAGYRLSRGVESMELLRQAEELAAEALRPLEMAIHGTDPVMGAAIEPLSAELREAVADEEARRALEARLVRSFSAHVEDGPTAVERLRLIADEAVDRR